MVRDQGPENDTKYINKQQNHYELKWIMSIEQLGEIPVPASVVQSHSSEDRVGQGNPE